MGKNTKNVYLICNAHIDPMWLWEWEEGAAAAVSTFRSAVGFCENYGTFVFNHNEVLLYKWIEEYEPELFERIKVQVKRGTWNIMGGWYLQPDCLMPSGEGFVRQITEGNRYFEEKFGVKFKTAVNMDSFGHSRGLVQIMAKCGYENYLVCRPGISQMPQSGNEFIWSGFDGSEIKVRRHYELYNSPLGGAAEKIENLIKNIDEGENLMVLWGVGNHGGGPSKKDIDDINALAGKMEKQGVKIRHSTPDEYFNAKKGEEVKTVDYSLTPCNTGCLSSMALVKQKYRELENMLFTVEKTASAASAAGIMEYPASGLKEVISDLLLMQFHDILPGSSIKPVEKAALRCAEHGLEILSRLRARCFFALSKGEKSVPGTYPVLVYNHHPYEVETTVECEFQLADQNWGETFTLMDVYDEAGNKLDAQIEKEYCNLNLDWRKRVVFDARLKPMSMNSFVCKPYPGEGGRVFEKTEGIYKFSSGDFSAEIDTHTGCLISVKKGGQTLIKEPVSLAVHGDTEDPWAMRDFQYTELGKEEGRFALMDSEEANDYSHIKTKPEPVRIIENGNVRTVIEALFKYNKSFAVIKYIFYKNRDCIEIEANTLWCEKDKALKLHIPAAFESEFSGETAYGSQTLKKTGIEEDIQKWCRLAGNSCSITAVNFGTYAASCKGSELMLTLQRSPAYSGHPINGREILRQDRYTQRIDQGEREYRFKLYFNAGEKDIVKLAQTDNEKPFALSFFPQGGGEKQKPFMKAGGEGILLTAFKKAEDGRGYIIRLWNGVSDNNSCLLEMPYMGIKQRLQFKGFEIKTYRVLSGVLKENNLKERDI